MINHIEHNSAIAISKPFQNPTSKTSFASALSKAMQRENTVGMDAIFERAAQTYNIPVNLLKAVGKAESNFNPDAVSSAGAQGIMQLMPQTAESLGVTNPFDMEQNIMGGAKYLSKKLEQYNGDVKLALAAYNAGSGNVAKYGGVPPFKETQDYVVKVIGYMQEELRLPDSPLTKKAPNHYPAVTDSNALFSYVLYLEFIRLWEMSLDSKLSIGRLDFI